MKLTIINGIPNDSKYFDMEKIIETELNAFSSHDIDYFKLRDLNISYCTGCWDCWMKTPGECRINDDQTNILESFVNSDEVLFLSPILVGYESALLKKTKDRIIPSAHPYIEIYNGEQHHRRRYPRLPKINVLLIEDEFSEKEDVDIIKHTYERIALNFQSSLKTLKTVSYKGGPSHVMSDFKW